MRSILGVFLIFFVLIAGSDVVALPMSRAMTLGILPQSPLLYWLPLVWGVLSFVICDFLLKGRSYLALFCGFLIACLPLVGLCEYVDRSVSKIEVNKRLSEDERNQLRVRSGVALTSEWSSRGETIIFEKGGERRKALLDALSSMRIPVSDEAHPPSP